MINDILYKLIKLFILLLGLLPRKLAKFCSDLLGRLWFKIDKRHRNITLENTSKAYPSEFSPVQVLTLGKKVFQNTIHMIFDIAWAFRKTQEELVTYYTIKGYDNLKDALKKGRGVLLLSGHIGNFELLVAAFGHDPDFKMYGAYRWWNFYPRFPWNPRGI